MGSVVRIKKTWVILCLFAALASGTAWPTLAAETHKLVLSSRETPLVNRYAEGVLKEAYGRLGINIEIALYPDAQSVVEANAGRTDGEVVRLKAVLKNYPDLRIIPVPLFESDLSAFVHADGSFKIDGWGSLKDYRLATIDGFKFVKNKLADHSPMIVENTTEAIDLVARQEVDIAVLNRFLGVLALAETQTKTVKVYNPPLESFPAYHLVHKRHEDLIPQLTRTLQNMKNEGVIDRMWREFTNREVRKAYKLGAK